MTLFFAIVAGLLAGSWYISRRIVAVTQTPYAKITHADLAAKPSHHTGHKRHA